MNPVGNKEAPKGQVYVCGACGKTSKTKNGFDTPGWDVSCMLHAVLCDESTIKLDKSGRVTYADAIKEAKL